MLLYCDPEEHLKRVLMIEAGMALALGWSMRCIGACDNLSRAFNKHPLCSEHKSIKAALAT